MADWAALSEGFRFDAWANALWLDYLNESAAGDPDRAILKHALSASTIWLSRIQGESLTAMPDVEGSHETISKLLGGWLEALSSHLDDPVIYFKRTTGEAMSRTVSEIAIHVVNHGTYHRGELRGLCRARGVDGFPETDRIRYSFLTIP